jgi:CubicO group peptidase (beta-lactamase class C family)
MASSACGGGGAAPAPAPAPGSPQEPIARSLAEITPQNQAATFRNVDRIAATRGIARGGPVLSLPRHARSLLAVRYEHGGASRTPEDYMARRRTSGLLILKNGEVALERYAMGNDEASRWTSFSVAKAFTAMLVGAALHDGSLDSLERRVETVVPALAGTAYGAVTVRQLLRMTSGVRWNEDYADPNSDIARLGMAVAAGQAGAVMSHMRTRARAAPAGSVWNYSSGESFVLGAVLAAVTGASLSSYASARIWSRAGMEADAYWLLDAPGGLELGGGNFSATLRDYGRLGLFVLRDGIAGSQRLWPVGWRDMAGRPDTPLTAPGQLLPGYPLGYGYHWWSLPGSTAFTGQGIYGQFLFIHPIEQVVAVVWGAWNNPKDGDAEMETYALIDSIVDALH